MAKIEIKDDVFRQIVYGLLVFFLALILGVGFIIGYFNSDKEINYDKTESQKFELKEKK